MNEMNGHDVEDLHVVRPCQTVHASVSVSASYLERRRVTLDTVCRVGETVVIDGQALVMTTSSAKRRSAVAAALEPVACLAA